ncbi:hypothetical protein KUF71_021918 [Frankliniella fusca]|uniref:Uncharacterized protein n=1 Tax=Frankliniella fusca TaxID=407009 RepID=A0AAE1LAD0_9NEOP|nr:hypothetical protein KUF71_021918 [Frankliniella fusca]
MKFEICSWRLSENTRGLHLSRPGSPVVEYSESLFGSTWCPQPNEHWSFCFATLTPINKDNTRVLKLP